MKQRWLGIAAFTLMCGCGNYEQTNNATVSQEDARKGVLAPVLEEKASLKNYNNVLQQLNTVTDRRPPPALTEETKNFIRTQVLGQVSRAELGPFMDDLNGRSYNLLYDPLYLDQILLFRDTAKSLKEDLGYLPTQGDTAGTSTFKYDLARHVFHWVCRHVIWKPKPAGATWPAQDVLRRGYGDSEDRLRVVTNILRQMTPYDMDVCGIFIPVQLNEGGVNVTRKQLFAVGVLVDKNLFLFDPYLGTPFKHSTGQGQLTFAELKGSASQLASHYAANPSRKPTDDQINKAVLMTYTDFSALTPRMKSLQTDLEEITGVQCNLQDDPQARLKRFEAAGLQVSVWNQEDKPGYPSLVNQRFTESASNSYRKNEDIVPVKKLAPQWALEADKIISLPESEVNFFHAMEMLIVRLRLEPGSPRDWLVRGKRSQAVFAMVRYEQNMDTALDQLIPQLTGVTNMFKEMLEPMPEMRKQVIEAMDQVRKGGGSRQRLEGMVNGYYAKWRTMDIQQTQMNRLWCNECLREHVTYFIAQAKADLADKAAYRFRRDPKATWPADLPKPADQYESAIEWLKRYEAMVIPADFNHWLEGAIKLRQECEAKKKEFDGA